MLISCLVVLFKQISVVYHQRLKMIIVPAPTKVISALYHLPLSILKNAFTSISQHKAEETKCCELCHGHINMIKKSDVMCKDCKLEISLGRQLK